MGEPDRHDVKQRWLAQAALVALLGDVTESSLASDTPASKLRQLGMLVYIIELIGESKPITLTSLVAVSGLSRSVVAETMDRLVERGSLTQSMGKNAWGRGKARQFDVGPAFRRLLEL